MAETSERPKGKSLRPLRELAPFLRPYLGTLYLAMAALVLASAAQLALPVAIRYLIDAGLLAQSAASIDRYFLGLFLVALAGLIASVVMVRTRVFGRATAILGIVANSLVLTFYVALPLAPEIAPLFPAASAPFRLLWYILIARRLFQLGRAAPEVQR